MALFGNAFELFELPCPLALLPCELAGSARICCAPSAAVAAPAGTGLSWAEPDPRRAQSTVARDAPGTRRARHATLCRVTQTTSAS